MGLKSLWDALRRGGRTANQVADLQGQLRQMENEQQAVTAANAQYQALLAASFRAQGGFAKFDYTNPINAIRQGFNISSAVYSIVTDISQKAALIPLKVYEVVDDSAAQKYFAYKKTALYGNPEYHFKTNLLKKNALKEVPPDNKLQQLIDNPSKDMSRFLFYQTAIGFCLITGNTYIQMPVMEIGADKGTVNELFLWPSQFTAIITQVGWPTKVLGYQFIIDGVQLANTTEVIHVRYPNYDYSVDGQQLYGWSPLKSALRTVKLSNNTETAANALLENGGPSVIIANKSISPDDFSVEQLGKQKAQFQREYAGPGNKGKYKMMAGDIAAIPLGMSAEDLGILEMYYQSFDMIANVYQVSTVEFNNHSGNTESNVKEMRKSNYTRAVLPNLQRLVDGMNMQLTPLYNTKGKKYVIEMDISGIAELQPDMKSMAEWLNVAWQITPNERREYMDFGALPDPNMDKVWMPNNLVTMDDASLNVQDIPDESEPITDNDEN